MFLLAWLRAREIILSYWNSLTSILVFVSFRFLHTLEWLAIWTAICTNFRVAWISHLLVWPISWILLFKLALDLNIRRILILVLFTLLKWWLFVPILLLTGSFTSILEATFHDVAIIVSFATWCFISIWQVEFIRFIVPDWLSAWICFPYLTSPSHETLHKFFKLYFLFTSSLD